MQIQRESQLYLYTLHHLNISLNCSLAIIPVDTYATQDVKMWSSCIKPEYELLLSFYILVLYLNLHFAMKCVGFQHIWGAVLSFI